MYFLLRQTLFLLPAGIPLTGKTPHSLPGDPSPPVTQGHQGAAPRHAFSVQTCVCYFTMNMCNGSCVRLYLRPRLFLHIGKYALKLVPTIPMRCHRVWLLSVGTLLILFCSSERPAFHRPGRLTYCPCTHAIISALSPCWGFHTLCQAAPTPDAGRCVVLFHLVASGLSFSGKGRSDWRKSYLHFHLLARIILQGVITLHRPLGYRGHS